MSGAEGEGAPTYRPTTRKGKITRQAREASGRPLGNFVPMAGISTYFHGARRQIHRGGGEKGRRLGRREGGRWGKERR